MVEALSGTQSDPWAMGSSEQKALKGSVHGHRQASRQVASAQQELRASSSAAEHSPHLWSM